MINLTKGIGNHGKDLIIEPFHIRSFFTKSNSVNASIIDNFCVHGHCTHIESICHIKKEEPVNFPNILHLKTNVFNDTNNSCDVTVDHVIFKAKDLSNLSTEEFIQCLELSYPNCWVVGTDAVSLDAADDPLIPKHKAFFALKPDGFIIELLTNLHQVSPESVFDGIVCPMAIDGADAVPCAVVLLNNNKKSS